MGNNDFSKDGIAPNLPIKVKKLVPEAVIPFYAHVGDAGMDVTCTSYEYDKEHDCFIYHTGLAFEVPKGYVMFIFPRSSNYKTDYYLADSIGVIDSCYRGELMFIYKKRDDNRDNYNKPPYKVGDRIGQMIILHYPKCIPHEVDELSVTDRGTGGFGSTGK